MSLISSDEPDPYYVSSEQKLVSVSNSSKEEFFMSSEHLELVGQLYQNFDQALGIYSIDEEKLKRAYHPVLERRKIVSEWQEHGNKSPFISKVRQGIERNLVSTLAERYHVRGGSTIMEFKNDQLWPDDELEPFIETVRRGAALRKILGTPDAKREEAEILGWEMITKVLSQAEIPSGTKLFSLSPPSAVSGSPYGENYVDEFVLCDNRKVLCRRTLVNFCLEDYEAFAIEAIPEYFENHQDEPPDAYFLAHPFVSAREIPKHRIVGFPPEEFEKIVSICSSAIAAHVDSLFAPDIEWTEVVKTLNVMFDRADQAYQDLYHQTRTSVTSGHHSHTARMVRGGCGLSGGFKVGTESLLINSAAQFSPEENNEYPFMGKCQICKVDPTRVGECSICKLCVETYFKVVK